MSDPVEVTVPVNEDGSFYVPPGYEVLSVLRVTVESRDAEGNLIEESS